MIHEAQISTIGSCAYLTLKELSHGLEWNSTMHRNIRGSVRASWQGWIRSEHDIRKHLQRTALTVLGTTRSHYCEYSITGRTNETISQMMREFVCQSSTGRSRHHSESISRSPQLQKHLNYDTMLPDQISTTITRQQSTELVFLLKQLATTTLLP